MWKSILESESLWRTDVVWSIKNTFRFRYSPKLSCPLLHKRLISMVQKQKARHQTPKVYFDDRVGNVLPDVDTRSAQKCFFRNSDSSGVEPNNTQCDNIAL